MECKQMSVVNVIRPTRSSQNPKMTTLTGKSGSTTVRSAELKINNSIKENDSAGMRLEPIGREIRTLSTYS